MIRPQMSRRRLLGATVSLAPAAAALAACAPGSGAATGTSQAGGAGTSQAGPATIVFLTRASENHRQLFDRFAQEFQQVQPTITVSQEFVPGGTPPFLEKETALVAAGQQPDVVFNEAIRWREAAAKALYEVLDPYLAKEKQLLACSVTAPVASSRPGRLRSGGPRRGPRRLSRGRPPPGPRSAGPRERRRRAPRRTATRRG